VLESELDAPLLERISTMVAAAGRD
jgi:hypothetical protein